MGQRVTESMPELFQFFAPLYPDCEGSYFDPADLAELMICWKDSSLVAVRDQLRSVIDETPDESTLDDIFETLIFGLAIPIGPTWRSWGQAILERVEEAVADPASIAQQDPRWGDRVFPPKPAKFLDEETANTAATEVLRAHEDRFRSWSADPQGWYRLHLYADLGHVVGHLPGTGTKPGEPVTGAVVLLKMDHETGTPFILTAYPEGPLDVAVRERYPDLANMFGGYLGQDWGYADGLTWTAMTNFHHSTDPPARDRVKTQLDDLLILDDDHLHAAVVALGAYALPVHLRHWLIRTRDYLDRFPPNAPIASPTG